MITETDEQIKEKALNPPISKELLESLGWKEKEGVFSSEHLTFESPDFSYLSPYTELQKGELPYVRIDLWPGNQGKFKIHWMVNKHNISSNIITDMDSLNYWVHYVKHYYRED